MEATTDKEVTLEDIKKEAAKENKNNEISTKVQLIIFKLGTEEYALPIDLIKEVVLTPRIAKMPQTPSYVKGVSNIRGNIIAILDLEEKFKIDSNNKSDISSHYTLVLESDNFKAGFLVREVPNTLSILKSDIEISASFIQSYSIDENCIQGVVKSGERLIILIDMVKLMESSNINQIINKATK